MVKSGNVVTRVMWRILPLMMLIAILNYMDRVNIAFAALQMNQDLKFSPAVYGFGAGIFFIGYVIFEVPSNLMVMRVGVRIWLARIMVSWGIIAMAQAWIQGEASFYICRFLLGVTEAGLFPCVMFYFREWIPRGQRAKALAIFMSFTAIANAIGGPLAAWIMSSFDGSFGLRGWQMMLLIEGIPSVLVGIFAFFFITERPSAATWLSADEKAELDGILRQELTRIQLPHHHDLARRLFRRPRDPGDCAVLLPGALKLRNRILAAPDHPQSWRSIDRADRLALVAALCPGLHRHDPLGPTLGFDAR